MRVLMFAWLLHFSDMLNNHVAGKLLTVRDNSLQQLLIINTL